MGVKKRCECGRVLSACRCNRVHANVEVVSPCICKVPAGPIPSKDGVRVPTDVRRNLLVHELKTLRPDLSADVLIERAEDLIVLAVSEGQRLKNASQT